MSVTLARGWNQTLRDQLDFHYQHLLRPRLEGLTDEEKAQAIALLKKLGLAAQATFQRE